MRIVFMGTPEFSVPCLDFLINSGHTVAGVFTQPDKPKGRGYTLTPPPVKELAAEHGIPVFQPARLRDGAVYDELNCLQPDMILVIAYGKILPREILILPKYGCVNIHASLLPKYRGAAPIQWSVINGESETGVTIMQMDEAMDTGDMLYKKAGPILPDDTAGTLHDRLSLLAKETLAEFLPLFICGEISPEKQNNSDATYAPMMDKSLSEIDFTNEASAVYNKIRGLSPWPVASATLPGGRLRIHEAKVAPDCAGRCGDIITDEGKFIVVCGNNTALEIKTVQGDGGRRMSAADYLRGHPLETGTKFISRRDLADD